MTKLIDMKGRVFGRITVIERSLFREKREAVWKCRCECGKLVFVRGSHLRDGSTKSCGCLQRENLINIANTLRQFFNKKQERERKKVKRGT